jgi:hypothetical protein
LNDLFEWVKANARLVLLGTIAAILLSIVIGFLLGLAKRGRSPESRIQIDAVDEPVTESILAEKKEKIMLLPRPVIPILNEGKNKYSFYLDGDNSEAGRLELIPVKISDLLRHREIGLDLDIKAFQFNNEELDIITDKNELVEP